MTFEIVLLSVGFYLATIYAVSYLADYFAARRGGSDAAFFLAEKSAPWYAVAFGMVGTSLSGVTFISVPGDVGQEVAPGVFKGLGYMQVVFGYLIGYGIIAGVLLPLYYRLNLVSIYAYLEDRFGVWTRQTGAFFFLLSRSLGSAARLYLAAAVLQLLLFDAWGVPFLLNVALVLFFIYIYTRRGGMQTIIYTDIVQTTILLVSLVVTLYFLSQTVSFSEVLSGPYGTMFFTDFSLPNHFFKQILSGALIAVVMTGLDQGMMQKNLSCRSLGEAQKNVLAYSIVIVMVNFLFVALGAMLYLYCAKTGIKPPEKSDYLFPTLAFHTFGAAVGVPVILGLLSAAYSSADDCLTALTTSFCIDFLRTDKTPAERGESIRKRVHIATAVVVFLIIVGFYVAEKSGGFGKLNVITLVLKLAGFTYGPLLGLYAFGLFTRRKVFDKITPAICVASPLVCLVINLKAPEWWGYTPGFELIALNGALTFGALAAASYLKPVRLK